MEKNIGQSNEAFIVLKPSSNEKGNDDDIYSVNRELFYPTPENVNCLLSALNHLNKEELLNIGTIKEKFKDNIILKKEKDLKLEDAEKLSFENGCNILGGVYLNLIYSYGIELGKENNSFRVTADDAEFMTTLYPDLIPFFSDINSLNQEQKTFSQGVIYNNTGSFRVIEVDCQKRFFTPDVLKKITVLKRIYRHLAKINIPFNKDNARCNLIHTPENLDELSLHRQIYDDRIIR